MITEGTTAVRARGAREGRVARVEVIPAASDGDRALRPPKARAASRPAPGDQPISEAALMWRRLAWLIGLIVWVFVALSLVSYAPGDPPATAVYPYNQPPLNLCGRVGAVTAHYSLQMLGHGVYVLVGLAALQLGITATGRRVSQWPVRLLGGVMMAGAVAGLQALMFPLSGPVPSLPGGLVGSVGGARLLASFSTVGSVLALILMLCVGAVVTLDVWAFAAALWTGRLLYSGARSGGRVAVAAARAANHRRSRWQELREEAALQRAARRAEARSGRGGLGGRPDDVSDDEQLPELADSMTSRVLSGAGGRGSGVVVVPRGRSSGAVARGGTAGGEADEDLSLFDPSGSGMAAGDPRKRTTAAKSPQALGDDAERVNADAGVVSGSSAAAVKKSFDPEELRAKMAKLPVRFAANQMRAATDEDLREVQGGLPLAAAESVPPGGGVVSGEMNIEGYRFPGLDLLEEPEANFTQTMEAFVREQAENLERALKEYRIDGEVVGVESGPVITLYEVRLAPGTKVAVLQAISSDLARSLKAVNIRIVPNTAGRDTVGIEVPNSQKEKVRLKELMTRSDIHSKMALPMFLGKDASGEPLICDLATMPHILIAGTTGSGKSVCMNTIIMSFLYTKKPNELKLVLVDPKMVELSQFKDIPHLMCPVVTEMGKAAAILEWAVAKMDERYELLAEAGCRDIASYNGLGWDELKERLGLETPEDEARVPRKLPYMVFVIDELADLMMTNKEVEHSIVRIAQKARAVGMHLIVATQRPQANVVTGLIKSNMPGRLCFKVASGMDSRIVLDQKGGELLLGQGDMLYLSPRSSKLIRSQGTLVDDREIRRVVKFMREVAAPTFERSLMQIRPGMTAEQAEASGGRGAGGGGDGAGAGAAGREGYNGNFNFGDRDGFQAAQEDPMFDEAVEVVIESKRGSVSMLQRRLAIGYTRAARLIEMMGEAGILGGHKGTVSRDVIMTLDEWRAIKAQAALDAAAGATTLQGGPGGEMNSHPATGETLEVVQARLNGHGGDGGRAIAAAFDEDDDNDDDSTLADEADDADDEADEEPPFRVESRRPGSGTRV